MGLYNIGSDLMTKYTLWGSYEERTIYTCKTYISYSRTYSPAFYRYRICISQ